MLTRWYLNRFKSFTSATDLDLRPITVLTGPNSAGKSSVIQSMLLLAQALTDKNSKNALLLNGSLITCGTTEDIISKQQGVKSFGIGCNISHIDAKEFNAKRRERSNLLYGKQFSDEKDSWPLGVYPFPEGSNILAQDAWIDVAYPSPEQGKALDSIPFQSQIRFEFSAHDYFNETNNKMQFMPLLDSFMLRAVTSQLGDGRLYEWNVVSDLDECMKKSEWLKLREPNLGTTDSVPEGIRYSVRQGGLPIEYFIREAPRAFSVCAKIIGLSFSGLLPVKYYIAFDELDQKIDRLFDVLGIPGGGRILDERVFSGVEDLLSNLAEYQDFTKQYENEEDVSNHPFAEKWVGMKPFRKEEPKENTQEEVDEKNKAHREIGLLESYYNDVTHPEFSLDTEGSFRTVLLELLKETADKLSDERASNIIFDGIGRIRQDGSIDNIWRVLNDLYDKDEQGGKGDPNAKNYLFLNHLLVFEGDPEPDPDGWFYFTPDIEIALGKYSKRLRAALKEGKKPRPIVRQDRINPDSLWRKIGTDVAEYFHNRFQYVGPLREDPKPLYPIGKSGNRKDVGSKGEQVAHVLHLYGQETIEYINARGLEESGNKPFPKKAPLLDAVNEWLVYMGVADRIDPGEPGKLGYALKIMPTAQGFTLDLTQVGVGASQVLPILTAGLIAEPGTTLVFEQPELHLHPRVQSRLADFFVSLMLCGKQVIVETHSEYIINRLRYRSVVAEGDLVASQVGILFFENEAGTTKVRNVQMNEYGYIGEWPKGFFDEGDELAAAILQAGMLKRKLSVRQKTDNA